MFNIGTFAIILNEKEQILLSHRKDYDIWNLPGGSLEEGEAPWEGIIREVKEETNLDVEIKKLTGIYNKPEKNEIVFNFLCKVIGGFLSPTNEADIHKYFNIDTIPHNTPPKQVERIKDYFNDKENIYMKNQMGKSTIQLLKEGKL